MKRKKNTVKSSEKLLVDEGSSKTASDDYNNPVDTSNALILPSKPKVS